jgi:hypothetical protein
VYTREHHKASEPPRFRAINRGIRRSPHCVQRTQRSRNHRIAGLPISSAICGAMQRQPQLRTTTLATYRSCRAGSPKPKSYDGPCSRAVEPYFRTDAAATLLEARKSRNVTRRELTTDEEIKDLIATMVERARRERVRMVEVSDRFYLFFSSSSSARALIASRMRAFCFWSRFLELSNASCRIFFNSRFCSGVRSFAASLAFSLTFSLL